MTSDRALKRKIRARMARTGERYTTARMHLLADDPAPKGAITAAGFLHLPGIHPDLAALRVLLANVGLTDPQTDDTPNEALLYGLSGGLAIGVMALRYEQEDLSTLWLTGWNPFGNSIDAACTRLDITPTVHETGGAKSAARRLDDLLAVGAPVVAWVDEATLGHTGMPATYEGGSYHTIAVYRVDGDESLIGDRGPAPIAVPTERLAAARARIRKYRHRLLSVGTDEVDADLPIAVEAALRRELSDDRAGPATTFSLAALDRLATRVHGDGSKDGWARMFPPGHHLWGALRDLYRCIEHTGSGGGLFRNRYADYLDEAAVLTGRDGLTEVAAVYRDLGSRWTQAAIAPLDTADALRATRDAVDATVLPILRGDVDAATTAARAWARLDELRDAAADGFPLDANATDTLLRDLQAGLRDLADRERGAAKLRADVLR
jgi:hypothetical protein